MHNRMTRRMVAAIALSLGLATAGCSGMGQPAKAGLDSIKQPVVTRHNFTLDVTTGTGGLSVPEQRRVAGWFESMDVRYGDRIAIDDPLGSPATRSAISNIAARYGLLVTDGAPVTPGYVDPGKARIVITRSSAEVPGCPDWSDKFANNAGNQTWSGFGCAVNSNLAAMVANPEHLLHGDGTKGATVVMSSDKAIDSYRKATPTGEKGLKETKTEKGE